MDEGDFFRVTVRRGLEKLSAYLRTDAIDDALIAFIKTEADHRCLQLYVIRYLVESVGGKVGISGVANADSTSNGTMHGNGSPKKKQLPDKRIVKYLSQLGLED